MIWVGYFYHLTGHPDFQFLLLKRKIAAPTVMGAICRKLLARIYVVLRDQRPYVVRQLPEDHSDSNP